MSVTENDQWLFMQNRGEKKLYVFRCSGFQRGLNNSNERNDIELRGCLTELNEAFDSTAVGFRASVVDHTESHRKESLYPFLSAQLMVVRSKSCIKLIEEDSSFLLLRTTIHLRNAIEERFVTRETVRDEGDRATKGTRTDSQI